MKEYFLTIRKHNVKDYVSERNIKDITSELKNKLTLEICDLVYEIDDRYNQLHSHVIVKSNRSIYYKDNTSTKGFRIYWKPIPTRRDRERIVSYMHKDSCNKYEQEQIIITNYYRHNYGFKPVP